MNEVKNKSAYLYHCMATNCIITDKDSISLYRFPENKNALFKKWCENLEISGTGINSKSRVCSRHFDPSCLGKRKLKSGAIPTLNLGHEKEIHLPIFTAERKKSLRKCSVPLCNTKSPPNTLFSVPDSKQKEWTHICKIEDGKKAQKLYICKRHFSQSMMRNNFLKKHAYPCQNLPDDPDPFSRLLEEDESIQPNLKPTCGNCAKYCKLQNAYYLKNMKIRKNQAKLKVDLKRTKKSYEIKINNLKNQLDVLKKKAEQHYKNSVSISEEASEAAVEFAKIITSNKMSKYSQFQRQILLAINYYSSKGYNFMKNGLSFNLPSASTLCRWSAKTQLVPVFNESAIPQKRKRFTLEQ